MCSGYGPCQPITSPVLPQHPPSSHLMASPTLCTQSLHSGSAMHLSSAFGERTSTKLRALMTLWISLSSNFPASSFSTSMNTLKPCSCRWTFSRLVARGGQHHEESYCQRRGFTRSPTMLAKTW